MQNQVNEKPTFDLDLGEEILEANFATLNMWRKMYLVLCWLATILVSFVFMLGATTTGDYGFAIGIMLFMSVMSCWTHWAVIKRNIDHITALAILNIFPGMNIIGCLIMFSIRRVSLNERKKYQIK